MFMFKFHSAVTEGDIFPFISQASLRNILRSNYIVETPLNNVNYFSKDIFDSLDIEALYNNKMQLIKLIIPNYIEFIYHDFDLFTRYRDIIKFLRTEKINYSFDKQTKVLSLENNKISIHFDEFDEFENPSVHHLILNYDNGWFSLSLKRIIYNYFPDKRLYNMSFITDKTAPKITVYFEQSRYFPSNGKSLAAKRYLEMQKSLIKEGKVIDAIKMEVNDIKSKTSTLYTVSLKEMMDYANTLIPIDFMDYY